MNSIRPDVLDRLKRAAGRIAASLRLEIFDVQVRREAVGVVVRVIIDRPAPPEEEEGVREEPVGIEDCQRMSKDFGTLLDVDDELTEGLTGDYTLEVSSPDLIVRCGVRPTIGDSEGGWPRW